MDFEEKINLELAQFKDRYHQLNRYILKSSRELSWYTENKTVLEYGPLRVRQFVSEPTCKVPLLIVYSHVNAPNVLDLNQRHSMVQRLLEQGHNVYLLDWGNVREKDKLNDLSVYIKDYIDAAVNCILNQTSSTKINLLGVCQGGTFALCYASLFPKKVNRLVTMVTPVDFHAGKSILTHLVKYIDFSPLEETPHNIPGQFITHLFQIIRPFQDLQRQVELIDQSPEKTRNELATQMDQWVFHCPDQPGKAFAQFVRLFFQENQLVSKNFQIQELTIRLEKISAPVLNVFAANDHLVPAESSSALKQHISRDQYEQRAFRGGHVGLMVSQKAQQTILPEIGQWLARPEDMVKF